MSPLGDGIAFQLIAKLINSLQKRKESFFFGKIKILDIKDKTHYFLNDKEIKFYGS